MHTQAPLFFDGQGAGTAGIAEILLQSHGLDHVVRLLPALPKVWQTGSFSGLCARGGFDLNLTWKDSLPVELMVVSKAAEEFRLKTSGNIKVLCDGALVMTTKYSDGVVSFATQAGKTYEITFASSANVLKGP
jgi:alpha-L-fucosidase 2